MPLGFPKDTGYRTRRERAATKYRAVRPDVRKAAWELDGRRCVFPTCRQAVGLESDLLRYLAHAHEVTFRSAGGDATDLDIVVTICGRCSSEIHVRVGGKTRRIEGSRARGLRFWERIGDDWVEVTA